VTPKESRSLPSIHRSIHAPRLFRGHVSEGARNGLRRCGRLALARQPGRDAKAGEPYVACVAAWFQRDEHVLRLDVFMYQAPLMDAAERRCHANCERQKSNRIERLCLVLLKAVPLKNAVERLSARVGENQDCPSFVAGECNGLGRPRGLKLGCQRVFVLEASQTLGQRSFRRRSHDQKGHVVAALPGPVKHEFRPIADCLQQVSRSSCHCNPSERKPAGQLNLARGAGGG